MALSATTTVIEEYAPITSFDREKVANDDRLHGVDLGKSMIDHALKQRVEGIETDDCSPGEEDAFFVADMGEVYRQHLRWKKNLKRVKPHYGTVPLILPHNMQS